MSDQWWGSCCGGIEINGQADHFLNSRNGIVASEQYTTQCCSQSLVCRCVTCLHHCSCDVGVRDATSSQVLITLATSAISMICHFWNRHKLPRLKLAWFATPETIMICHVWKQHELPRLKPLWFVTSETSTIITSELITHQPMNAPVVHGCVLPGPPSLSVPETSGTYNGHKNTI